jgi:hypothetical protein
MKDQQKQHLIDMIKADEELGLYDEPKQETLEEAAENYKINIIKSGRSHRVEYTQQIKLDFIAGAEWQQEQDNKMYSEEDMKLAFETGRNFQLTGENNFNELIEQFKKK